MKDKRNCNSNNYPIYQQPPMMIPPIGYQIPNMYQNTYGTNNYYDQYNNIEQRLNSLEQRVNRLENIKTNTNKYNDSNYYMV